MSVETKTNAWLAGLSIALYCCVSLAIVFLNRQIFTSTFPFPVFVSWFQQFVGLTILYFVGFVGKLVPACKCIPIYKFEYGTAKKILPLSMCFVVMIGFSNTCLKYVQVSTYQVARSLTLLFNLLLSHFYLEMKISLKSWMACFVVITGFILGCFDPTTLNFIGIVTGALSSLFQALYTVGIKVCLKYVDNDSNCLLFYNLTLSSVLFVPVIFIAGEQAFMESLPVTQSAQGAFVWLSLIVSGFLGVTLTFATYFCVKMTSPVTYNVAGYAKACIQSIGGILLLGEIVTVQSLSGIILTLAGSIWYSQIKLQEMRISAGVVSQSKSSTMDTSGIDSSRPPNTPKSGSGQKSDLHVVSVNKSSE